MFTQMCIRDRGTQSLEQYRSFANDSETVQKTESTDVLKAKLKSSDPSDTLIVTSIQKMGNIDEDAMSARDLEAIRKKRIVFIVDAVSYTHLDVYKRQPTTSRA